MSELLPCPFCTPTIIPYVSQGRVSREGYSGPIWRVLCPQCGASSNSHDVESEAIAAWNRRASAPPADVAGLIDWHRQNAAQSKAVAKELEVDIERQPAGHGAEDYRISQKQYMREARQYDQTADALAALAGERDRLREALHDIAHSGPTDSSGKPDAYAGWDWCYERARAALGGSDA